MRLTKHHLADFIWLFVCGFAGLLLYAYFMGKDINWGQTLAFAFGASIVGVVVQHKKRAAQAAQRPGERS